MTKIKEHWTKSAWTISIGTAIFSLLLTMVYDYLKEKPVLTTIWIIAKYFVNLFCIILDFNIKVWWIIVAVILFVVIVFLIGKLKKEHTLKPDFYNYREGKFKKWRWTWGWKFDISKNVWLISDLIAHCPNCDTPMINNSSRYELSFDCPRCDFEAIDYQCDEPHKIERIIIDNINRKEIDKKSP